MNTFVIAVVAAVAVLSQSTSAQCIPACSNYPLLLQTPVLSPIVSTPIVPSTTVIQTRNTVTDSLVDVLQMLPVCNLLADKLPFAPNLCLPVANPVLTGPLVTCGCGPIINPCTCGLGPIIF